MPPTTAELLCDRSLGALVDHRDISLAGCDAPQAKARFEVRMSLAGRASEERIDDVVLVADELVGNAVQHTEGPVTLTLDVFESGAVVGVVDRGTDIDAVPDAPVDRAIGGEDLDVDIDALSVGGRGLFFVALYASALSVRKAAEGKLVLAVLVLSDGDR
ncbi:ATP-binding protein [Streptomyces sp. NPDC101062]|uniref:ATP-binding protein n=1 Tax=unclassified Streptomyces TaxID=2593676 RepID=UPI00380CAACD